MSDAIIIEDLDKTVIVEVEETEFIISSDVLEGPPGPIGPQGLIGPRGYEGPQGIQGIQGDKGDKGEQGIQGIQGLTGLTGSKGDKGDKGEQGIQGPQGIQGIQGLIGPTGPKGDIGLQGPIGPTGANGPSGGVWRTANGLPSNSLGDNGDFYLDDKTGNVYQKVSGSYVFVINILGPTGPGSGDMSKSAYDPDGDGKVNAAVSADQAPWSGISGKPATFAPSTHNHPISEVAGLQTALDAKQPLDADLTGIAALTGDGYLTRLGGGWALSAESFAPLNHTHAIINITGLQTALDGKAATSHTHAVSDVLNLQTTLDGKAAASHTHTVANVTGLQTTLDDKAPLASPAFTGAPTAPQAAAYSNTQLIANTAQVHSTVTTVPENYQAASYTLVLADAGKMITFDASAAVTLTIPPFANVALPIGTRIDLIQLGSGQVSVAPGAGVTLLSREAHKKLSATYSGATLWKQGTNTWILVGDIMA